jgi:hypothetical protein
MIVQPMLISAWTASSTSVSVSTLFAFYLVAEVTLAMLAVLTPTALLRETNAIMASVRSLGEAAPTVVSMQMTVFSL